MNFTYWYDYEVDLNVTSANESSESLSSWSAYSVSIVYQDCPTYDVDAARHLFETASPLYTEVDKLYLEYFLPFLLSVGVVGNALFLYVVFRMKSMRTATNSCLASLAIADLIFLSSGIGEKIWIYHQSPFVNDRLSLGRIGCIIIFGVIDLSYIAGLCMVTLVSLERYYAVCLTQRARTNTRKSMFIALVVGSWILSIFLAASFSPASSYMYVGCRVWPDVEPFKRLPTYRGTCTAPPHLENYPFYTNILKSFAYFVLLAVNVWLYYRIIASMTRSVEETRFAGRVDINLAQRNKVARMLIVNGLVFFVCLIPFEIFLILSTVGLSTVSQYTVVKIRYSSQVMSYINSVVNPVIYISMSKRYRGAFKHAIFSPRCIPSSAAGPKTRLRSSTTTNTTTSTGLSVRHNVVVTLAE
ncbi:neuromedin-U receptor 2-like [Diadema setosum]|uniref:neuromedin-U receptor 2-like n=1 Tax=Diadema setosum TaxID=31175 RepID=UPI003B3B131F